MSKVQLLFNDTGALAEGLAARASDPLFMLCQQWRLGELTGENAGSIVRADIDIEMRSLPAEPTDLMAAVGSESLDQMDALTRGRLMIEASLAVSRWLTANSRSSELAGLRTTYPVTVPAQDEGPRAALLARAAFDVVGLAAALDGSSDPADVDLRTVTLDTLGSLGVIPDSGSWQNTKFRHATAVASTDLEVSLPDHRGGALRPEDVDLVDVPVGGSSIVPPSLTTLPMPVTYPGMPSRRLWAYERGKAWLGSVQTESDRMEPLLITEFAMVYGDDWQLVPIDLGTSGVLARITSVAVVDTFGQVTPIPSAMAADVTQGRTPWAVWHMRGDTTLGDPSWSSATAGPWTLMMPEPQTLRSVPHEDVRFFSDEVSNLGWAREVRTATWFPDAEDSPGAPPPPSDPTPPADEVDDAWTWTIQSEVPEQLFPMVPRLRGSGPQTDLALGQVRGAAVTPKAKVLSELSTDTAVLGTVPEESLRAPGAKVVRRWRRARRSDGTVVTWAAREAEVGRPERDVGIVFDSADRKGVTG